MMVFECQNLTKRYNQIYLLRFVHFNTICYHSCDIKYIFINFLSLKYQWNEKKIEKNIEKKIYQTFHCDRDDDGQGAI